MQNPALALDLNRRIMIKAITNSGCQQIDASLVKKICLFGGKLESSVENKILIWKRELESSCASALTKIESARLGLLLMRRPINAKL